MSCIMPCVICHAMCPTCPHYSVVLLFCFLSVILLSIILIIMICDIMMLFLNNANSVTSTPDARDAIASKNIYFGREFQSSESFKVLGVLFYLLSNYPGRRCHYMRILLDKILKSKVGCPPKFFSKTKKYIYLYRPWKKM